MAKSRSRWSAPAGKRLIAVVVSAGSAAASGLALPGSARAFGMTPPGLLQPFVERAANSPFILVQNPSTPFTLPQMPEPPVSPRNSGTLPGSTAAGSGSGSRNPITGLPCSGGGSISVSGPSGIGGSTTAIGTPSVTSIYGPTSSFGAC